MDFGDAIKALKEGKNVRRSVWRDLSGQVYLSYTKPVDRHGQKIPGQIDIRGGIRNSKPWIPKTDDLMATDWTIGTERRDAPAPEPEQPKKRQKEEDDDN